MRGFAPFRTRSRCLTLPGPRWKSNVPVQPITTNFYAQWRARLSGVAALREEPGVPPERLLQAVWLHQRLTRDKLTTLDGQRVQVLHPGFWNREAGPDFRGAVVQLGEDAPRSGDVEIDLRSNNWRGHRHDTNPNFQNVLLHVVWEGDTTTAQPTLALKSFLDSPLGDLAVWLGTEAAESFPGELAGRCCAPLRELPAAKLTELLHEAALVRLHGKAAWFEARARQAGWEQALWEGLFRALGYKQNLWPMQRLAELRARLCPPREQLTPLAAQSRLLGVSGLLPAELTRAQAATDDYLRRVWDGWWREREAFRDCALPRALWRFNGLRPANHPQRRLALAAHWLARGDVPARIDQWCAAEVKDAALTASLLKLLQADEDEFWTRHWTLRSARMARAQPLLGEPRVTDLAVNVILPWLWMRAVDGKSAARRDRVERRYLAWPSAEDNAVLRLARQRLLDGAAAKSLRGAATQQGLLQIVRDFCEHSNALCDQCQFPDLVRQWSR